MNGSRPPRNAPPPGSNAATFIALAGLILVGMGLLGIAAMVLPQALGVLLVIGLFIVPVAFHYLVWGWWLTQVRDRALAEKTTDDTEPPAIVRKTTDPNHEQSGDQQRDRFSA